ncbi:IBR finger domain-containing protein [Mariannaea sp. PMI_226]|nr:IBR finger domain-containing protein [Mariannaea sp. PMI_226]
MNKSKENGDATALLIIELQIHDLEETIKSSKGKHREGEQPDDDVALDLYRAELENLKRVLSDRRMCKSIAKAVFPYAELVQRHEKVERQATRDRQFALNLVSSGNVTKDPMPDTELLKKLEALNIPCPDDDPAGQPESSSWAATRPSTDPPKSLTKTCHSCNDDFKYNDVSHCPCTHEYCRGCLTTLFTNSITDESLYPPRCCRQAIPLEPNRPLLPPKLVGEFLAKKIELEDTNRTYCHDPICSVYIPVQFIKEGVGCCPKCERRTCVMCKGSSHKNECPNDPETQELLQVAAKKGWQRCHSCRTVVKLGLGCYHITCRCKARFCYLCGNRWKTCSCVLWSEDRLIERANTIANTNVVTRTAANAAEVARLVERARQNLIQNHECRHPAWNSRSGSHRCEFCDEELPVFILECTRCSILACRRCKDNRFW